MTTSKTGKASKKKRAPTKKGRASTKGGSGSGGKRRASTKGEGKGKEKGESKKKEDGKGKGKGKGKVEGEGKERKEESGLQEIAVPSRTPAPAPLVDVTVAIFETSASHQKRAVEVVRGLGYRVTAETTEAGIRRRLSGSSRPHILLLGIPGGETLLEAALRQGVDRPVIVASLQGPASSARERCEKVDADLFSLRPHGTDHLAAVLHAASRLAALRDRVQALRGTEEILRERLARYGQADVTTGFQHFDFVQRFLIMELKRARRYGYSLAVVLVAIDPRKDGEPELSPEVERKLRTRAASAIAASIRDIDLPIDFADDRMLAFLPYTDLEGATQVGKRVAAAVKSYGSVQVAGGETVALSVSIGIAALKTGKPVSFARLMKDAGAAVRAAQLKGGGRIVVRK